MTDNVQPPTALGVLLANTVDGVVQAQAQLDRDALGRLSLYMDTPEGGVALPPLWYTMSDVAIELELAASVTRVDTATGPSSRLDARLLNPTAVSLFGYTAASGLKVSLRLAPREAATAVPPLPPAPPAPG